MPEPFSCLECRLVGESSGKVLSYFFHLHQAEPDPVGDLWPSFYYNRRNMMDKSSKYEKLLTLADDKLMDVVRNYRQYGYTEQVREEAIGILESRGITPEDLQAIGVMENKNYDFAEGLYQSFLKNSYRAFGAYLLFWVALLVGQNVAGDGAFWLVAVLVFGFAFLILLVRSFLDLNQLNKMMGDGEATDSLAVIFLFGGFLIYIVIFPYVKNQVKEKMQYIR